MKNITLIALTALLVGMVAPAQAGPLDFLFKSRPDQWDNRHDNHRRDNDRGFDRGNDRGFDRGNGRRRPMSREARAQLRLRELGYYRGAIDGSFGRGSRAALIRFQRDNRIRPTGWLDERTRRALRI